MPIQGMLNLGRDNPSSHFEDVDKIASYLSPEMSTEYTSKTLRDQISICLYKNLGLSSRFSNHTVDFGYILVTIFLIASPIDIAFIPGTAQDKSQL